MWNPTNGYVINNTNPFNLRYMGPGNCPKKLPTQEYPLTTVYKPHGSLSFLVSQDNIYEIPIIFLDDNDLIDGKWCKGNATYLKNGSVKLSDKVYVPFIVPPIQDKGIIGEFLFKVYKDMDQAITVADVIVVIGWSLPLTDSFLRQFIFSAIFKHDAKK